MTQIAILVPVLGRPERALPLAQSAAAGTDIPYRLVFLCSPEDGPQIDACQQAGDTIVVDWNAGPGDYARKISHGYQATSEPWIFTGADDLIFHPGWAREALRVAGDTGALVIGTNDLGNPQVKRGLHSTHSLFAREYCDDPGASWDGPGTVYSTAYDHQWIDAEAVAVAKQRGVWAFAYRSVVEHTHFLWGKSPHDATYSKALARGREDAALYRERHRLYLSA